MKFLRVFILAAFACVLTTAAHAQTDPLGGQPARGAKPSVKDLDFQFKYQRAFEAVLWALPAVSIHGFRRAAEALGVHDDEVIAYSKIATPKFEALTANDFVPYITAFTDLRTGPVVLEMPPATEKASLFGQVVDAWQVTIAEVGPSGADQGRGGKYLLLPAGYDKEIPPGYIPIQTGSMRGFLAFRSVPGPKGSWEDAADYARTLKLYSLVQAAHPPQTKFVDPGKQRFATLPRFDENFFKDIYDIVSVEPVRPRDKVMMGMLASLGIEPGKPFKPDAKTVKAMKQAAMDAYFYLHQRFENPRPDQLYWPERKYVVLFAPDAGRGFKYETDTALLVDDRAWQFSLGTYYPKTLEAKPAVVYIGPVADNTGKPFVAGKTYKITLPKDMPVKQFWFLNVYDAATFAFIYTPNERASLSSFDAKKMKANADGGVTLYIGPKAPPEQESNWIPTQGKKPLPVFRLYGATDAFFDKSVKLPDFELVGK
jgi:hypothetical protein